jgi:hypothetical protein
MKRKRKIKKNSIEIDIYKLFDEKNSTIYKKRLWNKEIKITFLTATGIRAMINQLNETKTKNTLGRSQ